MKFFAAALVASLAMGLHLSDDGEIATEPEQFTGDFENLQPEDIDGEFKGDGEEREPRDEDGADGEKKKRGGAESDDEEDKDGEKKPRRKGGDDEGEKSGSDDKDG